MPAMMLVSMGAASSSMARQMSMTASCLAMLFTHPKQSPPAPLSHSRILFHLKQTCSGASNIQHYGHP